MRQLAERWMRELWRDGDADAVTSLHTPDFVDRSSAGRPTDNTGFADAIRELFVAFPDFAATTEALLVDGDLLTIRWSATGTHRGAFLGHAPTDEVVRFTGIEILRVVDGLVAERWGEWDGLALVEQLRG